MSTFRNAIPKLNKERYFLLGGARIKAKITGIKDDMVRLQRTDVNKSYPKIIMHIDNLMWFV